MIRGARLLLWLYAASAVGCGSEPAPSPSQAALPPAIVARVGDERVHAHTVAAIASTRGVALGDARQLALYDAVLAIEARRRFAGTGRVSSIERAALARAQLDTIYAEARAEGPPNDLELEQVIKERWYDYDRPLSARTTHAVVQVTKPDERGPARELAERIAAAVRGVSDPKAFITAAEAVPRGTLKVIAERLPAVTADGRTVPNTDQFGNNEAGRFHAAFAAAANALDKPGDHSPVVESESGFHVILLEDKLPQLQRTRDELRAELTDEIVASRARRRERALLERLRRETPIEQSRAAADLLSSVQVAR